MRDFRTIEQYKQDKIKENEQSKLWFEETIRRMEADVPYPECVNHNGTFQKPY